jgi:hypothetical protein
MTNAEKQLLLKELCARLPYGVIVQDRNGTHILTPGNTELGTEYIKPYLRPMSSMTKEEKEDFGVPFTSEGLTTLADTVECMDWLIAHHFDYRGLIENGLALEAPEDMYIIQSLWNKNS